ncbi:head GIN domain-containing protein [Pseudonocardia sp. CA-107938]|uniref:head GIN domain-containing protein n=1 Tax=Pseudonocardia sp. CA-107938 TaxID=3240021 RepID=UPI003D91CB5A
MSTWGSRTAVVGAAALAVLVVAGCGLQPAVVAGTGAMTTENRTIANVTGVDLNASGQVEITNGPTLALTIEAPSDVLPVLTSEVTDGVLRLSVQNRTVVRNGDKIHYRLTVPALDRISVSGAGRVRHPDLKVPSIRVDIDGSGDVVLRGAVDRQVVSISGSGSYSAPELATRTAEVEVDGSGDADVRVTEALKVDVSGSGTVTYHGTPTLKKDVSGSGDVTQAP